PNHLVAARKQTRYAIRVLALVLLSLSLLPFWYSSLDAPTGSVPQNANEILAKCRALSLAPGPPAEFHKRTVSDRFDPRLGGKPVLIRNATIWSGKKVISGDIHLDKGVIRAVGNVNALELDETEVVEANGAWVTPGIVDLHSHVGVEPMPNLAGAADGNSFHGPILPWLRSLDGLNTHDDVYRLAVSGGVTTSLILPGSANAIGGQAFVIKLRPTSERSPEAMLVEPPFGINGSDVDPTARPRWRHMNLRAALLIMPPARVYSQTRMDTVWQMRQAYETARKLKSAQDTYCKSALAGTFPASPFPEDLQWEALVDVLRGRVKVQTHCYEAVDIDAFVRLSNEFQFPVAAFHHAHEAYLVPEVLKRAYGHTPAIAMFATFSRYKREAYRHSEFAPRILADEGVDVVMKSDNPGIVSRFLLHEAQQAHYWGLPADVALKSVTSTPARAMGLDHRLGFIKQGYDADIVLWDTHPLQLGATPMQVWVDGIPQLTRLDHLPVHSSPPSAPRTPNFDREAKETLRYEGLPPLEPRSVWGRVVFTNVSSTWAGDEMKLNVAGGTVVVEDGRIVCSGLDCDRSVYKGTEVEVVDLEGGTLTPALVAAGTALGLQEIAMEPSTTDGSAPDPFGLGITNRVGEEGILAKAVDGLQFGTRDALLAYRSGVTTAITAPLAAGGISVSFSLGAEHKLQRGAVVQAEAALHVEIDHSSAVPSVSTQIAALRALLLGKGEGMSGEAFKRVAEGRSTLVVKTNSADTISSLLLLKREVEAETRTPIKLTLLGASEAHLLAPEIADAGVGVVVAPVRSAPYTWDQRRILPGPPLTEDNLITTLFKHNVTVGIAPQGVLGERVMSTWAARNARFDAAWISLASGGVISKSDAHAMASRNIEKLLGVESSPILRDIVATKGGDLLSFEGKVVAIISPRRGVVDVL
ncbi:hypothetical protein GLOTRDRAFT_15437, partial [Gloeophyllum trabeum ATCC 11539]